MPSVTISPSDSVPKIASEPSRSRVGDGGGLRTFLENMIGYREFSGRRQFIGERATRGDARERQVGLRRGQPFDHAWVASGAVGPPAAPLLALSLFLRKNKSCKFAENSPTSFSETKRQQ